MKKRIIALIIVAMFAAIPIQALGTYSYSNPGDKNHFVYYQGSYDQQTYPRQSLNSIFTTNAISVDGILDTAYDNAPVSNIGHVKVLDNMQYADNSAAQPATGTLRSIWDGTVLYLFVEVIDETPENNGAAAANGGAMTSKPAVPKDRDSVVFGFDLYNEKVVYETDTTAVFTIDSTGNLTYFRNQSIPSLGSVHADPNHPEFTNRLKSYSAKPTANGYNVELALHIEGVEPQNGSQFGVDVQICNVQQMSARTVQEPNPWYPWFGSEFNTTVYPAGPDRSSNTFWSHNQDSLYEEYDHERPNAVDWGTVTLTGWNGIDEFAFSSWRILNNLQYLDSIRFPKGVWTPESQEALDQAVTHANELVQQSNTVVQAVYQAVYAQFPSAAINLENAISSLRWADTRYPDPMDLPDQFTLPNPYQFFGNDGQSDRMVKTLSDWQERRAEILDLAQFYEYGYKPQAPDEMILTGVEFGDSSTAGWWETAYPCLKISTSVTYGEVTKPMNFEVFMPSDEQLAAAGHGDNVPVIISFDGRIEQYLDAGIAVLKAPAVTGGDNRTNEYAWGTRSGIFYEFFPYSRNGQNALKEVSSEMAAAWGVSRAIDALELIIGNTTIVNGKEAGKMVAADKLAVTGFSINGKYAFVSAVFDERIDVCIPGAAGATGPSPWRYVYAGQAYDWSDTQWAPNGAANQVAFGTEFMANSVRHNRVRETETFRRFLTPGNFYKKLDGAYGYGTRLPFDQNDLVATLAPRAIIVENTLNDYNDGCVTDALSLDLAKTIYSNLQYDADDLIKYNYRTVQPSGDPHGNDGDQRSRSAAYLNYYFYNTPMESETETWLATNPYTLDISNNKSQSPYDYYYGGYNTITGGTGGVEGTNGWYSYKITGPDISNVNLMSDDRALSVNLNSDKEAVWYASISSNAYTTVNSQTFDTTGTVNEGNNRISFMGLNNGERKYISLLFVDDLMNETLVQLNGTPWEETSTDTGGSSVQPTPTKAITPTPTKQPFGVETKTEKDGVSTVTLVVDPDIIESKLAQELKAPPQDQQKRIELTIKEDTADRTSIKLTGESIAKLTDNDFELSVARNNVSYTIAAKEIAIEELAKELELSEQELKNVQIEIQINQVSDEVRAIYEETARNNYHELVFPPVEFSITASTTNSEGTEESITIQRFSNYVNRTLEIPEGVDPAKITTGVVFNSDGTYNHVPTVVFERDGKWYASLNSLTNSDYSVLSNPITVVSVENHWSKEAVNDMASRLVISNPHTFAPKAFITRGEFAQYISKALCLRGTDTGKQFTDITATDPLADDIDAAVEYGIIKGFLDGTFKPNITITRQEAMAMYSRAMDVVGLDVKNPDRINSFSDRGEVSEWAYEEVKKVLGAGVFNGTSETTISPMETFTYAEAATAIRNLLIESGLINE